MVWWLKSFGFSQVDLFTFGRRNESRQNAQRDFEASARCCGSSLTQPLGQFNGLAIFRVGQSASARPTRKIFDKRGLQSKPRCKNGTFVPFAELLRSSDGVEFCKNSTPNPLPRDLLIEMDLRSISLSIAMPTASLFGRTPASRVW